MSTRDRVLRRSIEEIMLLRLPGRKPPVLRVNHGKYVRLPVAMVGKVQDGAKSEIVWVRKIGSDPVEDAPRVDWRIRMRCRVSENREDERPFSHAQM